jgi:hypothetical protein
METGCMRAVPDNIANAKKIFDFFQTASVESKKEGFNTKQIAECIDRDVTQVSIKLKRLGKMN